MTKTSEKFFPLSWASSPRSVAGCDRRMWPVTGQHKPHVPLPAPLEGIWAGQLWEGLRGDSALPEWVFTAGPVWHHKMPLDLSLRVSLRPWGSCSRSPSLLAGSVASHKQTVYKAQLLMSPGELGDLPPDLFINQSAVMKRHTGIFRFSSVEPNCH